MISLLDALFVWWYIRGGVEDTKLEAKDTKKSKAKDRPSRGQGQNCLRPRTKDTGANVLQKNGLQKFFSGDLQNFNDSKNSAVLELRTGQFSRTWGFDAKTMDFKMCPRGLHLCCL